MRKGSRRTPPSSSVSPRSPAAGGAISRREFVSTTGSLLGISAIGAACHDPDAGTVEVTILGLEPGFTSAGSATITGDGLAAPLTITFQNLSHGSEKVRAGTYQVVYAPPAGYTMAAGSPNSIEVTVRPGETTSVTFEVELASGSLELIVQGLGGSAQGGSAEVLRTDIAGQTPLTVVIPADGDVTTSVQPGTYSVTYTPPSGLQLSPGQENPRSVTVDAGQTTTVTYQVVEQPPAAGVIFSSDFSTALGTSDAALLDTGKASPWDLRGGQGLEVIASTGLDFPTANVLRVMALTSSSGFAALRKGGLPVPGVGESRFYRWYIRAGANIEDANTHPIQDGVNAGASNWQFEMLHTTGGANKWTVQFKMGAVAQNFNNQNYRGPALDCDVTYRFEIQVHRISTSTYNFHVRVFNSANVQLFGDADFQNIDGNNSLANQSANGQFAFLDPANLDGLNAGCNGVGPLSSDRLYSYQAAFAISASDWLGPYNAGV